MKLIVTVESISEANPRDLLYVPKTKSFFRIPADELGFVYEGSGHCKVINIEPFEEKGKEWPTTQGLSAGVWVNASERQPEDSNLRLGKLNGKPVLVTVSKLIDGYISCNGHIEPVIFVEWLDESLHPSVNGWSDENMERFAWMVLNHHQTHAEAMTMPELLSEYKKTIKP